MSGQKIIAGLQEALRGEVVNRRPRVTIDPVHGRREIRSRPPGRPWVEPAEAVKPADKALARLEAGKRLRSDLDAPVEPVNKWPTVDEIAARQALEELNRRRTYRNNALHAFEDDELLAELRRRGLVRVVDYNVELHHESAGIPEAREAAMRRLTTGLGMELRASGAAELSSRDNYMIAKHAITARVGVLGPTALKALDRAARVGVDLARGDNGIVSRGTDVESAKRGGST